MKRRNITPGDSIAARHRAKNPDVIAETFEAKHFLPQDEALREERQVIANRIFSLIKRDAEHIKLPEEIATLPVADLEGMVSALSNMSPERMGKLYGTIFFVHDEQVLRPEIAATLDRHIMKIFPKAQAAAGDCIRQVLSENKETHTTVGLHTVGTMINLDYFAKFPQGNYLVPGFAMLNKEGKWCVLEVSVTQFPNKSPASVRYYLSPLDNVGLNRRIVTSFK